MPYLFGASGVALLWVVSFVVTKSANPFRLAASAPKPGDNRLNGNISASQLQFLLFSYVTVFTYGTVSGGRFVGDAESITLASIPVNLLLLMGMSVASATASKGITVSYLAQGRLPNEDQSSFTTNRNGTTDLNKIQMITWTVIAVVIYLAQFIQFVQSGEYLSAEAGLPEPDGALLVLMGVSNGGYVAGKLVSTSAGPLLEKVLPSPALQGQGITIWGTSFGSSKDGNSIVLSRDQQEIEIPRPQVGDWTETRIEAQIPAVIGAGTWQLRVRSNGLSSPPRPVNVQ